MSDAVYKPDPQFAQAISSRFVEKSNWHFNLTQDVILITGDKLELCLRKHMSCLELKGQWITPASLLAAFAATLASSTFHDALMIPANVWHSFFLVLALLSGIWLAIAIVKSFRLKASLEILLQEIKQVSNLLNEQKKAVTDAQSNQGVQ